MVNPDGVILSAEALIRWPHPERGMLSPAVFLPVAEQGGLMRELDRVGAAGDPGHHRVRPPADHQDLVVGRLAAMLSKVT